MTKRCPGKCGRVLHVDQRICSPCRSKLTFRQKEQLNSGVDIATVLAATGYSSGSSSDYSGGGACDGGSSF